MDGTDGHEADDQGHCRGWRRRGAALRDHRRTHPAQEDNTERAGPAKHQGPFRWSRRAVQRARPHVVYNARRALTSAVAGEDGTRRHNDVPFEVDHVSVSTIVVIVAVVAIAAWAMVSYNGLVRLRNQAANGWRQIDVQLKRRHDLIPNLVNAVRGAMDFERDTLTAVMEARSKALTATGPADAAQKEGQLTQALGRLIAVAENYPTLKANDNVKMLQEELTGTENKVGFAGQFYNAIATSYNTAQQVFPATLFAPAFGFKPAELFEITNEAEREAPVVDLSRK